jgi:sulfonate transport system permease protein
MTADSSAETVPEAMGCLPARVPAQRAVTQPFLRALLGRRARTRASRLIQYLVLPLAIVTLWETLCRANLIRVIALPAPSTVAVTFWGLCITGQLPIHVGASLLRVLEGFAAAAALGLALGVAVGISTTVARFTDLIIQILRPIPPIAWIPLAILWFGIGEASKVYIIFLGAFFPIIIGVIEGIRNTDHRYVEVARVLETSRWRLIRRVVLPGALPTIITGLRIGLGNAWVCVVAAELIAAERGVGYIIVDGREMSRPDLVIAGMISIGVIGKLMDVGLRKMERVLVPWRAQYRGG